MQLTFKLLHTNFSIQYQILPADDDLPSLSAERIYNSSLSFGSNQTCN